MKFEIYSDAAHLWRWRLVAKNGRIVGDSGEGYVAKAYCLKAIRKIRWQIFFAALEELAK